MWREFYVNDAGNQIDNLARSVQLRALGVEPGSALWPEDGYRGDYIAEIAADYLARKTVSAERVTFPCRGPSAEEVAMALCQGTPLRNEIEQRAPDGLAAVTAVAARALREAYGTGPIESTQRAILFEAET